jgi:hypothetical protein
MRNSTSGASIAVALVFQTAALAQLSILPTSQSVASPGDAAPFVVTVTNPTATSQTFVPSVGGSVNASWGVQLPASVTVPAGGMQNFNLVLTTPFNLPDGSYPFMVIVDTGGGLSYSVPGTFIVGDGLQFFPVAPCRLIDTRGIAAGFNGIAPFSGPSIAAGGTLNIPVQSASEATANTTPAPCGAIPSTAQAYSVNITVVPQAGGAVDYVSLWPAGSNQPFVSTLDDPEGLIVANAAVVPAGTPSGGISVFNAGPSTADVVIDMNGYFAAATSLQFYPVAPCRLVDTRGAAAGFNGMNPFAGPSILAMGTLTIPVQSPSEASADTLPAPCGVIPSTAQAYSFNLTVVPADGGAVDYVSMWPAGSPKPFVSTLDDPEGLIVANAAIVPAGAFSGGVSVFNAGPSTADVILDQCCPN